MYDANFQQPVLLTGKIRLGDKKHKN